MSSYKQTQKTDIKSVQRWLPEAGLLIGCYAMGRHSDGALFLATDFEKIAYVLIVKIQLLKEMKRAFANFWHDRTLLQAKLITTVAGYSFL